MTPKMLQQINMCRACDEPTKSVAGFFDGPNNMHGCRYDCKNAQCEIKQLRDEDLAKSKQKQADVAAENQKNNIIAKDITTARAAKKITIFELSKATNLSCAKLSAYEHERKAIPVSDYEKIMTSIAQK